MQNRNRAAIARRSRLIELPDGSHIELKPLNIADLATLEEEFLQCHRRQFIELYARNLDLLPAERREPLLLDAIKRCEEMRPDNLDLKAFHGWCKTFRGELTATWLSMRASKPGLTIDEAAEIWNDWKDSLKYAADAVGELTAPTLLGNELPPEAMTANPGANQAIANQDGSLLLTGQGLPETSPNRQWVEFSRPI